MQDCSQECVRRALYAVLLGISPIVTCLLLIGLVRIILHVFEFVFCRHIIEENRRSPSPACYHNGRPTLLYTPVSITELHRIIQGDYYSQQPSRSSSVSSTQNIENNTHKTPKFIKSLLSRRDSPPPSSSGAIANLIGCRHAINTIPFAALLVPVSMPSTPKIETINEKKTRQPSFASIKNDSIEKSSYTPPNRHNFSFDRYDSAESEPTDTQPLCLLQMRTMSATASLAIEEEAREFYSTSSIPYAFN
ncbi:unnamed protein product [Rotaria magnacalcarata]|uniref:Uncharacterized protein n=2 Tax=Rotaria magnacalcarata TaxID=392030 RepID=A0A816PI73_9BILA|nr:unnamed protein product [Rotaria magnacalcarata]CAF1622380.1 unnamed protein product [Rotaria magnacalcarata]CAF2048812.1 unnamed protein product [Rotaria magnacalcarata]CAF2163714.1 unnamed protein product [Rotaria magnacalcarata]CAF2193673.1 unnamed protein product [Rotaria magnacalcarata]